MRRLVYHGKLYWIQDVNDGHFPGCGDWEVSCCSASSRPVVLNVFCIEALLKDELK